MGRIDDQEKLGVVGDEAKKKQPVCEEGGILTAVVAQ